MRHGVDAPLQPWSVSDADYPARGEDADKLRFLLRYAVLAPSAHNTQPWLFAVRDRTVELYADRTRALPVVDPDDRALIISCGAALETLVIAVRHFGHSAAVEVLPDPADGDLLARVALGRGGPADHDADELFAAVTRRRSNRRPFDDRVPPLRLGGRLVADARAAGVELHLIGGDDRAAVAELIADGDRLQMADKRFRRELAGCIHPNRSRSRDGMRGYAFGFADLMSHAGPRVVRAFDLGGAQAAKDRQLAVGSPLLAAFVTDADRPPDWVASGRALQRVLLRAQAAGVSSSFLNQPVEVAELRPRLAELIGRPGSRPQLLMRLGYGPEVPAEPRRAVDEVLLEELPQTR